MSNVKKKSARHTVPSSAVALNGPASEVFTLAEAAAYLRLDEAAVLDLVHSQNLPGKSIGTEWRFLKLALQNWLQTPLQRPCKEAVLARIGSWQNDPFLEQELKEIHKRRGRPLTESGR